MFFPPLFFENTILVYTCFSQGATFDFNSKSYRLLSICRKKQWIFIKKTPRERPRSRNSNLLYLVFVFFRKCHV